MTCCLAPVFERVSERVFEFQRVLKTRWSKPRFVQCIKGKISMGSSLNLFVMNLNSRSISMSKRECFQLNLNWNCSFDMEV